MACMEHAQCTWLHIIINSQKIMCVCVCVCVWLCATVCVCVCVWYCFNCCAWSFNVLIILPCHSKALLLVVLCLLYCSLNLCIILQARHDHNKTVPCAVVGWLKFSELNWTEYYVCVCECVCGLSCFCCCSACCCKGHHTMLTIIYSL